MFLGLELPKCKKYLQKELGFTEAVPQICFINKNSINMDKNKRFLVQINQKYFPLQVTSNDSALI